MYPMMALLVSTAALYVSYRMDWKESSRAPSLANSSAHALPAVVKRQPHPAWLALTWTGAPYISTPSRCGLHHNVSEAYPDSPPHVSMWPSRYCAPLRSTFQASEHRCTVRDERRSWLRQDNGLPQCP